MVKGAKPPAEGLALVLAAILGFEYTFIHMSRLQEFLKNQGLTLFGYLFSLCKQVSVEGKGVIRLDTPFVEGCHVCIPLEMRYNWCRCF